MKSIAAEINELRQMTIAELIPRYCELFGRKPRVKRREHLWRRCAWKLQERRLGGLSRAARRRLDDLTAEIHLPLGDEEKPVSGRLRRPSDPPCGTVLTRIYKGHEIRVEALENGYEWNGVVYRSLSATARAITGSRWNGRLFLGLTARRRGK